MKTTSLKLQRIAAILAIIAAPMPSPAIDGPTVSTWIPGTDVVETVGSVSTTRQPGPYNSRDTYKVFVTAVAGKDLRMVVTGVKNDYFDEIRTNGLYAVFGAVDPGTITLDFQWSPAGANTWTSAGTKQLTVGNQRTMIQDTEVPISAWYDTKDGTAGDNAAAVEGRLEIDFPNMKADGFTCVNMVWKEGWIQAKSTIYANLTQHGMKAQQHLYAANSYVTSNMSYPSPGWRHHNVVLLGLETELNKDMLADVGGGVKLKDHPQLFSYYLVDEATDAFQRGVELEAMLAKNIDPFHGSGSSATGIYGSVWRNNIQQTAFEDFVTVNLYPLGTNTATSDFSKANWQGGNLGLISVPDYLSWAQNLDPRRYLEVYNQTHNLGSNLRTPSPKELRALVMMSASRGSRPFNYFFYGWFGSVYGLLNPGFVRTANLDEARLINAKLASWIPTYKNLKISSTGSTPITYALNGAVVGNFVHKTTADRYLIVVNTNTTATSTKTVNGVLSKTGTATTATDVVTGTVYNLSGGTLNISLGAGDGALLLTGSGGGGATTLYTNNMETATTYASGTLVTSPAPHGGSKSEQRPANSTIYASGAFNAPLPASVSNLTYSVWIYDNNNATQTYSLLVKFRNPTTGAVSALTGSTYVGVGTGWTQIAGNFTSIVNQRIGEGYTQLSTISLRANNSGAYVTYYADDVAVTYQ